MPEKDAELVEDFHLVGSEGVKEPVEFVLVDTLREEATRLVRPSQASGPSLQNTGKANESSAVAAWLSLWSVRSIRVRRISRSLASRSLSQLL